MDLIAKFQKEVHGYRDYDERMGNKLRFIYNVDNCEVTVYSEEWDAYDGYDNLGSPYFWAYSAKWEDIILLQFAKLMEYYMEYKQSFDEMGIICKFVIL